MGLLRYRLVQLLAGAGDVPLLQVIWTASGSTQPPTYSVVPGVLSVGQNWCGSIRLLPSIFLCGVDRDNYIFICAYESWDSAVGVVTVLLAGQNRV